MKSESQKNFLPFGLDLVVLGLWLAIILAFTVMGVVYTSTSKKEFANMEQRTATLAHMLAEHAQFKFDSADLLLLEVLDHLSYEDMNTVVSMQRRKEIEATLAEHRGRLPNHPSYTVIGADGNSRYGTENQTTNLSDRKYFAALRDGNKDSLILKAEGDTPVVHVARRKTTKDGKFAGVIVVDLPLLDLFYEYYVGLKLPKTSVVSLREREQILISFPEPSKTNQPLRVLSDLVANSFKGGALVRESSIDGVDRMNGYEQVGSTEMFVVVGESVAATMAGIRVDGWMMVFAGVIAFLAAIIATSKVYQLRRSEEFANFAAQHDDLTKLNNRAYLSKNFDDLSSEILARGDTMSVIFLDLDNFKTVNNTFSHAAGDQMLVDLSKRLATVIGEDDELIRLGGDEFIIIHKVRGKLPKHSTEQLCWKLINSFSDPFTVNGQNYIASASLGAALAPMHGTSLDDLCRCADIAMYRGKVFGKGVYTAESRCVDH